MQVSMHKKYLQCANALISLQTIFASIVVDCEQKYELYNFVLDIPAPYLTHIDLVDADLEVIR